MWMIQKKKNDEQFLAHYGVKGMKWGVRRQHSLTGNIKKDRKTYLKEADRLGKATEKVALTPYKHKKYNEREKLII